MRMRRRAVATVACALFLTAGVAASCSTFGDEDGPPASPREDATTGDVATGPDGSAVDGGPPTADASTPSTCPPPKASTRNPTLLARRTLYTAPAGAAAFPFGIATDATHVTWVEQPDDGDANSGAYDGRALARIMRKRKLGTDPPRILADKVPAVISVVIDNGVAYFVTWSDNTSKLFRVRLSEDCDVSVCPPEEVTVLEVGFRIARLYRHAPGVLIALADNGKVLHITLRPDAQPVVAKLFETGIYPGLTLTNDYLYASTETENDSVWRSTVDPLPTVDNDYLLTTAEDGGNEGVATLATDCNRLFMARYFPTSSTAIYGHDFGDAGSFTKLTTLPGQIFDMATDDSNLYIASPSGGLFYLGAGQKSPANLAGGNVFRVAVDGDGIYYGVHLGPERGTIMMLIK